MSECILCLVKVTRSKSIKLSEKVSDALTLSEAIREQLTCGSLLLSQKPPAQQAACYSCHKAFKAFYDFLTKITEKHAYDIKAEQPELSVPVITVTTLDNQPIEFEEVNALGSSVKMESERSFGEETTEEHDQMDNRFNDSDFEWSMDEESEMNAMPNDVDADKLFINTIGF